MNQQTSKLRCWVPTAFARTTQQQILEKLQQPTTLTIEGVTVLFPPCIMLERQPLIDSGVGEPIPGRGRQAGIDTRGLEKRMSLGERKRRGHFVGKNHWSPPLSHHYYPRFFEMKITDFFPRNWVLFSFRADRVEKATLTYNVDSKRLSNTRFCIFSGTSG